MQLGRFRVSADVSERVAGFVRRVVGPRPPTSPANVPRQLAGRQSRVLVLDPPEATFVRHDPELGVDFIKNRMAHTRTVAGDATAPVDGASIAREVAAHSWYHTIELPHGIETPGYYDHRDLVPIYGIPSTLEGQRVLDVATSDGFWAFEFERRGGQVTAIDVATTSDLDLPPKVRQLAVEQGYQATVGDGFELAHRLLGSHVTPLVGTVYELDPDRLGRFDLVHTGDLLLHLRDPIGALQQLRRVTEGQFLLSDVFDPAIGWPQRPESGVSHYLGGSVMAGWWMPSFGTLVQMVVDAGFSDVEVVAVYSLLPRGQSEGPWRAVLRARP